MKTGDDEFYIGYQPHAPAGTARCMRRRVLAIAIGMLAAGAALAWTLPYFGSGRFEYGHERDFAGVLRCEGVPRLESAEIDYLLVGAGKHGAPVELCSAAGTAVTLRGTLIEREGRALVEVARPLPAAGMPAAPALPDEPLGSFTLSGEIVDPKCYFGVMNPAEGRAHRACAVLCLRGGIPPLFVARDRAGAVAHLLLVGPDGRPVAASEGWLRWVGEPVEGAGAVSRRGRWLVWQLDPATLRPATR